MSSQTPANPDVQTFCNSYHSPNFSPEIPHCFHNSFAASPHLLHRLSTEWPKFSTGYTEPSDFAAAIDYLGTIGFRWETWPQFMKLCNKKVAQTAILSWSF